MIFIKTETGASEGLRKDEKMFLTRLISGIFLVIFTAVGMVLGKYVLLLSLMLISLIGLFELYRVMKTEKTLLGAAGYISVLLWYGNLYFNRENNEFFMVAIISFLLVTTLVVFVVKYPKYTVSQLFSGVFGMLYIPVMLSFIYQTRESIRFGSWIVWLVYVSSWGSDTCAYIVGKLFGKTKLAPVLSPKKSVEGAVGGIAGSALIGVIFAFVKCTLNHESYELVIPFGIIGGLGSVISQIGDLAASGIKRNFEVKDYGNIIPGHGGILDRYDSVIITSPIVYFLASYFMGRI